MSSRRWSLLAGALVVGACAQEVDDLPVPRAWSYGTAEVTVVESPAGASVPTHRSPPRSPGPAAQPGSFERAVSALERTLAALVAPTDRRVAADSRGSARRY
ncbi:MAG: hypothetical protein ABW252_25530 [Polyangiales bacterium]